MLPTNPENPAVPLDPKRKRGGYTQHKPGCACIPCKSRRRKEEAESNRDGSTDIAPTQVEEEVINADLPALITQDRTNRGRIAEWIAYRSTDPTLTNSEIAEKLGIQPRSLASLIYKATREGWLKFDNPLDRVEHEIVPLTLDKLKKLIKNDDKNAIIETAKGVIFPLYKESRGVSENQQTVLAIKIEYPKQDGEIVEAKVVNRGNIVGKPNLFEEP